MTKRPVDTVAMLPCASLPLHVPKFSARWRPLRPRDRLSPRLVPARCLAAALHEFFADAGDGDACGCARLLLSELAAALRAEPERQGQQGAAA
eukprot:6116659-Prymnesium_polylepis.1